MMDLVSNARSLIKQNQLWSETIYMIFMNYIDIKKKIGFYAALNQVKNIEIQLKYNYRTLLYQNE